MFINRPGGSPRMENLPKSPGICRIFHVFSSNITNIFLKSSKNGPEYWNIFAAFPFSTNLLVLIGLLGTLSAFSQPVQQQSFQLQEGWNAIFLEIEPDGDIPTLCAGLPYTSIWTWDPHATPAEKVQDQDEGLWNQDGWLVHFPAAIEESIFNNLHRFNANRAYLIHVTAACQWLINGTPRFESPRWRTAAFNLTGFPIDPILEPAFSDFLSSCDSLSGGPIYQLLPDGHWEEILDMSSTVIKSGTAYWVYCNDATDFHAPLSVTLPQSFKLDYNFFASDFALRIRNHSPASGGFHIQQLPSAQPVPLAFWQVNDLLNTTEWVELPFNSSWETTADDMVIIRLAVDRSLMTETEGNAILEMTDGAGTRLWIPMEVQKNAPSANKRLASVAETGLWVGSVEIDMVSQAQIAGSLPTPTRSKLNFRLIIHVDHAGVASLIKNIVLMTKPAQSGQPAHSVLVTDDSLLSQFEGIALMGGDQVGIRISTVAYDFPGDSWELGTISNDQLSGTLTMEASDPTNPFLHRYHPDHDNLDAEFEPIVDENKMESFSVDRQMTLLFQSVDPFGNLSPEQSANTLRGTYQETLNGLHKNPVHILGKFRLHRASRRGVLND